MDSLRWVDQTYVQKHKSDDPTNLRAMYYPNLDRYGTRESHGEKKQTKEALKKAISRYVIKYGRKGAISLTVLALSYLPKVGRFVLPAASFYTFQGSVGAQPALVIFGTSLLLPRRYLVTFLQTYFSSRTLMRELVSIPRFYFSIRSTDTRQLEPYFCRVRYSSEERKIWFKDRAGVLFGFSLAFFAFVKIPLVGVLIYGLAEASTAYLITKITEPPLPPEEADEFRKESLHWKNKQVFLSLPWQKLDQYNISLHKPEPRSEVDQTPRKTFT